MNENLASKTCPHCGSPVPVDAPQGLCPKCVLSGVATATESGHPAERDGAPPIEQVRGCFPQFEIVELIGQGGMGFVYKARQKHLDRFVALKLLWPRLAAQASFAERFNREARVLARLNHPNVVAVYDFGQAGEFFFLLMEYVDGVNMRQALKSGRFRPAEALALVPRICDALQYAHEEGVLHRDIKPENILLDTKGRLKIADFGIAKLVGTKAGDIALTETGVVVGTPHYMAPEQLERPQDIDQRADIYSLGVVFYEMLTGELPVGRFEPPSEKAPVDPRVDEVVLRALERQREKRFSNAGEVKTRVENIRSTPPETANPAIAGGAESISRDTSGPGLQAAPLPLGSGLAAGGSRPPVGSAAPARPWSKKAIVASICAAVALLPATAFLLTTLFFRTGASAPVWFMAAKAIAIFGLLGGAPVVAGTALGILALRDIRRSRGELRGGPLALCATLFWPMLVVDLVALRAMPVFFGVFPPIFVLPAMLLILGGLTLLVAWAAWRGANGPANRGSRLTPVAIACVLLVLSLPVLVCSLMVLLPVMARSVPPGLPPSPSDPRVTTVPNPGSVSVDADFVLPAGQVAILELVTRKADEIEPVPGLSAYAIAAPDQQTEGKFQCQPDAGASPTGSWRVEIEGAGNKSGVAGIGVPDYVRSYSGHISIWKLLESESETLHWMGSADSRRPALGLRIRTLKNPVLLASRNSAVGLGTNWLGALRTAEATDR